MRVLDPPAVVLPQAAPGEGYVVRRNWLDLGHDFAGFGDDLDEVWDTARHMQLDLNFGDYPPLTLSLVAITVQVREAHAGRLCTDEGCPTGVELGADGFARLGDLW
ncbi:MAG: hypothetical protein ABUL56_02355 [Actinomycetota bacterium]